MSPTDPSTATVQLLTPEGTLARSEAAAPYLARLEQADPGLWREAYRSMRLVRAFDREATNLQRQGELALYVPAEGQEGAQIGSALALKPQDTVFPSYREHGVGFVRGLDLVNILALLRGVTNAGWDPETSGNFRNYALVIATQTLHATGYAMGQRLDGLVGTGDPERDEATIVYFGDGSTSQGDLNEALVFARSYDTPQLFFLQNNQWAISVPVAVQSPTPLYRRADGFGMPGVQIDGNDVMASYAVSLEFLDRARAGDGPAFIEALTYRMGAHTTSDDPTKYRTREEEQFWRDRDPITRLAAYLRAEGEGDDFFDGIEAEAKDYAADVRRRTLALPDPEPMAMFTGVYAERHPLIEAEIGEFLGFEASLEENE
ncbi:thiamine pyrophosphate-dependent dehydrogenase E1 component subunit alpha [Gulosibacter sp. ACHW.36C]|uniref:2-oxoisovalerate dehydrogenase subunit alpha n=1 Tax=Gulosibacter sediminis TaxID=1729695 RepID=A0ABY4MWI7_9MICO|nr:thiamine pyrophosphate-dependent dehydrogenase E1 component subunit alpha [Gulosibacter sediminis]UQN14777.1 thiamine pyrophosphate-dependent dehydrogenase E1 component subunit alpha [Gulosibacter sediminis]